MTIRKPGAIAAPDLDRVFRPASLAIIGASPKPGSARNSIVKVPVKHGFPGRIHPVTPSHAEIEGLTAYPTVADLPEVPDLALIITPRPHGPGPDRRVRA